METTTDPLSNKSTNISNQSQNNSAELFPEREYCDGLKEHDFVLRAVWIYGGYPILILGTIGHILSLVILLTNKGIRQLSLSVFLLTMSLSGLTALYAGLLSTVVMNHSCFNIQLKNLTTETGCRLHMAVIYFSLQLYSWMEASVSIERLCAVTRPHKYKVWFTRRNNIIATLIVVAALVCINVTPYQAHGYQYGFCEETNNELFKIWRYAHCVLYVALPVAIMLPANGITLYMMCHSNFKDSDNVKKAKPITIMMFVLNGIFIVTTIPIMVGDWENLDASLYQAVLIGWAICRLFMYLGSSLTFVVYIVVSARFRRAFKELLTSGVERVRKTFSTLSGRKYNPPEQRNIQSEQTDSTYKTAVGTL